MNTQVDVPIEAQIAELERRWADAFRRKDIADLERFLAEGYALIIAVQGVPLQVVPRNAWLASLNDYEIVDVGIDCMVVHVYDSVAVVVMLWRQEARLGGEDRSAQFSLTDIWVCRDGEWRIAERHSSRPEHPGAARPSALPSECFC